MTIEDCISRQAVIEITAETGALETQSRVRELPPVTLKEKAERMTTMDKQCENCEHHDYCEWLYEYQDFGIVCNDYTEIIKADNGGEDGERMTFEEAKKIFLNRGYIEVHGGTYYDADKWRESITVISRWLEQQPCEDMVVKTGHWIDSKDWIERRFDSMNFRKHCSLCNHIGNIQDNFCPNCGARMVSE